MASPKGTVCIVGNVNWKMGGKKGGSAKGRGKAAKHQEPQKDEDAILFMPHKFLFDSSAVLIATGTAALHSFIVDVDGNVFAWGKNDQGQLGVGNLTNLNVPAKIDDLSSKDDPVVDIACGKNHSLFATRSGRLLSCGGNQYGQLGLGSSSEYVATPTTVTCSATKSPVVSVKAGIDFSIVLTKDGEVLTFGCPEYGKLGHNTDGQYNTKASSVKMAFAPQPTPKIVKALQGTAIKLIAAGNHHSLAADSEEVYAWGCGSFGRLGGGPTANKDKWVPTACACDIWERMPKKNFVALAAGATSSAVTLGDGMLYQWGRLRPSEEATMYPKPLYDLQGWDIRCISLGTWNAMVGAESSCIAWGQPQAGTLGFGEPPAPKSSSKPKKIDILEGAVILKVACGFDHGLILIEESSESQAILAQLPTYEPEPSEEELNAKDTQKFAKATTPSKVPTGKRPTKRART